MALWIPLTILAAFIQNLRFMLQKQLKDAGLTTVGATFARFLFAAPVMIILILAIDLTGRSLPVPNITTGAYVAVGGLAQIMATICVVALFGERNFTVGVTLKKTEAMLAAIFGFMVLGEVIGFFGGVAILIGIIGVLILSDPPKSSRATWTTRIFNKATGYGLASGVLFAVSATCYRGASLSLGQDDFMGRAIVTLAYTLCYQSVIMSLWLLLRDPYEIIRVIRAWRTTLALSLFGLIGSICWFTAFTLQSAAYVKALGQVELIFTVITSYIVFKEKSTAREFMGMALIVSSILMLVFVAH